MNFLVKQMLIKMYWLGDFLKQSSNENCRELFKAKIILSKGFTYILECADGSFYTGSTKNLEKRLWEHNNGLGANYTKSRIPVDLVYFEEYTRIDEAFYREKQIQGWSRRKKLALIEGKPELLPKLAKKIFWKKKY